VDPHHPKDDEVIDRLTGALTAKGDDVPEPPAHFERMMWARVRPQTTGRPGWTWRVLVPAAALAASVVLAIVVSRQASATSQPSPEVGLTADATSATEPGLSTGERVLFTALDGHLAQTEALLVEVRNADERADREWERTTADDLVSAGRLYRQTAEFTGRRTVVRMLDDLEPVLVELARSPERIAVRERDWLRTRIVDDSLLFKVRAMSMDLKDEFSSSMSERTVR
jgi:hypothetical protein